MQLIVFIAQKSWQSDRDIEHATTVGVSELLEILSRHWVSQNGVSLGDLHEISYRCWVIRILVRMLFSRQPSVRPLNDSDLSTWLDP